MKVYKNLFKKIITINNFKKAYKNATKGKNYYTEVKAIRKYGINKYLRELLEEVKNKKYKVSKYTIFKRFTGLKWREIYKLPMKDRIIQHAIMNVIEPIFRETFIVDTYSSIKYKGLHFGLKRLKRKLKNNKYNYYLKLDIYKCYPSLDKQILKDKLSKKFKDKDLLQLLFIIIDSCENGVPIGNYTSQYFNNFYFNDFDHWIKEIKGIKGYFRYCDDIIILGETKDELHSLFKEIKNQINKLNVKLKDNYQIYNIDKQGVDFLGYITYKDHIKIRKHIKQNFINKINKIDFNNLQEKDINILGSYWGIFTHADCRNLWYKYTKMSNFSELNINVHDRDFVKNILYIPISITKSFCYKIGNREHFQFYCSYKNNDKEYLNIIIDTTGVKLIEAGKQFKKPDYPINTTIIVDDKGFYKFV